MMKRGKNISRKNFGFFMNLPIQKPTKTIIINMSSIPKQKNSRASNEEIFTLKAEAKINFYEMNESIWIDENYLNKCYENLDEDGENIGFFKKCKLNESEILKKLVAIRKDQKKDNYKNIENILSETDIGFLELSLKNDIRIKKYNKKKHQIEIYFWTVEDGISFYQQYARFVEMSFIEHYYTDFRFDGFIPESSIMIYKNKAPDAIKIDRNCNILDLKPFIPLSCNQMMQLQDDYLLKKEEFHNRLEYFNKLKTVLSKNDYRKMENSLESNNKEFIYLNCKELSV